MSKFLPLEAFRPSGGGYRLLPLRFSALDADRYIVTNLDGEYHIAPRAAVHQLVRHELPTHSPDYEAFKAAHMLLDDDSDVAIELLALKTRTKHQRLTNFTALHLFVVTLRCEHSCPYCQVSRQNDNRRDFDMSEETASKALAYVFRSPAPAIKIEFQGGEPLLNFDLIRFVVLRALEMNQTERRNLAFVIATNLAVVTDEILE